MIEVKEVLLKYKILINGIFPLKKYSIDSFEFKTGKYDETVIDSEMEDYVFYGGGYLILSSYSVEEKDGVYYSYFENDELLNMKVPLDIYNNKYDLQGYILNSAIPIVYDMKKKLRLITNIGIGLPIFQVKIHDINGKLIAPVGNMSAHDSQLSIHEYDAKLKALLVNRLKFDLNKMALKEVEDKNSRFKRSMTFYNEHFEVHNNGVKFTLLFSALESLFNLDKNEIRKKISLYTSKILFLNQNGEKKYFRTIKKYYDIRSNFIHGNKEPNISKEMLFNLSEIVREVLLIYWFISLNNKLDKAEEIIEFIEKNNQTTISLTMQSFIKALHMTDYESFYNEMKNDILSGKTNLLQ